MDDPRGSLDRLLTMQPLAVLATSSDGAPYTSLVAIAAEGCEKVFFATPRATRKWSNVLEDPRVSLLSDDRSNAPADLTNAIAATGIGLATECVGQDADIARAALRRRHPHMSGFLDSPSTVIAKVEIERWYLVSRFQSVHRIECRRVE
jgi:heme iron utilization protein